MEIVQEQKHECKVCKKRFFSGRSLGGHMRCHTAPMNPAPMDENHIESHTGFEDAGGGGGGGQTGYGLRENPKKSWRLSSSNQTAPKQEEEEEEEGQQHDHVCKVCDKGFNSSRALFGHMRHHSRQENFCRECGKGFCSSRDLSGHRRCHSNRFRPIDDESTKTFSQSQEENSCPTKKKRSRRYYKISSSNPSSSNFNYSSSVTLSEPELEEGAFCLMLLSRAVTSWVDFNSVSDSSDCNSAIVKDEDENFVSINGGETSKILKEKEKRKTNGIGSSDSGLELGVLLRNDDGLKKKLDFESQHESCDGETEKKLGSEIKIKSTDLESLKHNSSKRAKSEPYELDLEGNLCNNGRSSTARSKRIYKCSSCSKIFPSRCGLVGHRLRCLASNSKSCGKSIRANKILPDGKANPNPEKLEYKGINPIEQQVAGNCELKRSKDYECGVCFKVFASGQALGGHKRAHYAGSSETGEEATDVSDIFDLNLNLPTAPEEEGGASATELVGLKPWSFRGGHDQHESLVGVISN